MKKLLSFVAKTMLGGFLILIPVYLTVLLLLKAMAAVAGLVRPVGLLMPDWVPAERLLSLLLVLLICFLIGAAARTDAGRALRDRVEKNFFARIPGYAAIRGLTHQIAGDTGEKSWRPALAEIEEALVPAFVIEELADGRYTVFVPSVPTPLAGTVYVLEPSRVHLVNVPFTRSLQVISRWGSGAKDLVAAMVSDGNAPKR